MTFAEITRLIKAKHKAKRLESQEKASYDYILARLITKGTAIVLGDKSEFPSIDSVYSGLFDELREEQEEKMQESKAELSALRFKQFANSYNDKFVNNKEVASNNDE
jgi:hypothetical protein